MLTLGFSSFRPAFTAAIRRLTPAELSSLLFFIGGSVSLPVNDPAFKIQIQSTLPSHKLPIAHTCFWQLEVNAEWPAVLHCAVAIRAWLSRSL